MNLWKLHSPAHLVRTETAMPTCDDESLIRVRVRKVFLNSIDVALYRGRIKAKYPFIPGRFAIGNVVDDTKHLLFPKGARVLLHTYCPAPDTGNAKVSFEEDDYVICGQTVDGFLRDFLFVSPDNMLPLPDSVNDEGALLAHFVALARASIDKLNVRRGQHIAVIGANLLGILVCQLLIYQQAAPILIDAEPHRLEFAKKCGVYYTIPADDHLMEGVGTITGGRLVSGAVFVSSAPGNDRELPFSVCARGANIVLCGYAPAELDFDLEPAVRKQISVHGMWNCVSSLESAINLLATHAVDLSGFRTVMIDHAKLEEFYEGFNEEEASARDLHIVNMV